MTPLGIRLKKGRDRSAKRRDQIKIKTREMVVLMNSISATLPPLVEEYFVKDRRYRARLYVDHPPCTNLVFSSWLYEEEKFLLYTH
jgi:hypothetical protein